MSRPTPIFLAGCLLAAAGCGDGRAKPDAGEDADATTGSETTGDTGLPEPDPTLCRPISTPVADGPGSQQLELVASRPQIPGIAEQPTERGQVLGVLAAFDGRLHLGYGDYSDNTGPIAMFAWDPMPASGPASFVDLGVLPTEVIVPVTVLVAVEMTETELSVPLLVT